jgi:TATA-binding protein-associated factor
MEEWTRVRDEEFSEDRHIPLHTALPSTQPLVELLWKPLESGPPAELYEVQASLQAMRREMEMVSSTVARLGKRPKIQTPIDIDDDLKAATAEELQTFVDLTIERSIQKLSLVKRAEAYSLTRDRRDAVSLALQRHKEQKEQLSNQIKATAAAALIGVRFVPPRLNPLVGSIMQGVKVSQSQHAAVKPCLSVSIRYTQSESNQMMQNRAANSVANFIANCLDPRVGLPAGPAYKLVNNLANFICEDEDYTPKFNPSATVQGVITLQAKAVQPTQNAEAHALTRRGSEAALSAIVNRLGTALFEQLPNLWDLMAQPILLECEPGMAVQLEDDSVSLLMACPLQARTIATTSKIISMH